MKIAYQIDSEGFTIDKLVVEDDVATSGDIVTEPCPAGFIIPQWNGTAWQEGGDNIYFEYVTAASCERDGKILTTGEIMWAYRGTAHGEWTEVDAGCAVIGPYPYATASQTMIDAGADEELYFVNDGQVQIKPNAEAIKQAREANRVPTTDEKVARLQYDNKVLASTNSALSDQVNGLIDYMTQTGQLV